MVEKGLDNSYVNSDVWGNGMVHENTVTTNTDLHTSIERDIELYYCAKSVWLM